MALLAEGLLGIADLAALCFGIAMLAMVHSEMSRGGERWGLLLVKGSSTIGLPVMALLLVATILLAIRAKRSVRVSVWVASILVGVGIVTDAGAVGWILISTW